MSLKWKLYPLFNQWSENNLKKAKSTKTQELLLRGKATGDTFLTTSKHRVEIEAETTGR